MCMSEMRCRRSTSQPYAACSRGMGRELLFFNAQREGNWIHSFPHSDSFLSLLLSAIVFLSVLSAGQMASRWPVALIKSIVKRERQRGGGDE